MGKGSGGVDRSLLGQRRRRVSRLIGSDPTLISGRLWELFVDLTGDVAFQAAHDLGCGESLGSPAGDVLAGFVV